MSSLEETLEHGYCASNRIEKWWPISSTRESDQPKSNRKHRRRVWAVPKNQPLIDSYFARDLSQSCVKKSLFTDVSNRALTDQTFIDNFLTRCNVSALPRDKAKRMLFGDDCLPSTSSKPDDIVDANVPASDNKGPNTTMDETVQSPLHNELDPFSPAGSEDVWCHGNAQLASVPMVNSTAATFLGYVEENFWERAVKRIDMTKAQSPPVAVLKNLLHNILLKSDDPNVCTRAFNSLNSFLELYPPCNVVMKDYYHEVLFSKRGWDDWTVFKDLIKCCKKKCGFIPVSCDLNCILVLKYFVAVLEKEYDEFMKVRPLSPFKYKECPKLIKGLIWGSNTPQSTSYAIKSFVDNISRIFSHDIGKDQLDFLNCLVKLIGLAAECHRLYEDYTEEFAIANSTFIKDLCHCVCSSTNIIENIDNLELFVSNFSQRWLRIALCESLVNHAMDCGSYAGVCGKPLTLRKIVLNYMLIVEKPSSTKSEEELIELVVDSSRKRRPKLTVKRGTRGKTPLHQWCAEGLAGTLSENLRKPEILKKINATDSNGWTPLHEACYSESYLCVLLCSESESRGGPPLNVCPTDDTLLTPLHIAIWKNSISIARKLLEMGGVEQLDMKNEDGTTPLDLVWSKEMKKVVDDWREGRQGDNKHLDESFEDDIQRAISCGSLPDIYSVKEGRIYLFSLHMLLAEFFSFYDLLTLFKKTQEPGAELDSVVRNHLEEHLGVGYDLEKTVDDLFVFKLFKPIAERFLNLFAIRFDLTVSESQELSELLRCFRGLQPSVLVSSSISLPRSDYSEISEIH